jgi:predicted nucleic acid-binding protein
MPFVIDASVTAVWALSDEASDIADSAYRMLLSDSAIVPAHWWFEVRNTLIVNERRKRLSDTETASFLHVLSYLPIGRDLTPNESAVLRMARAHNLTVYDAACLELAERQGIALATLDADLVRAARTEGIALIEKKEHRKGR